MHCIFLGIIEGFLKKWISPSNREEPFYIGNRLEEINQRVLSVKLPHSEQSRMPRPITLNLKHFKAHDYKLFLLYFSIVMRGILPERYFLHFQLLVTSVRILSRKCKNTQSLVKCAQYYINEFLSKGIELYGESIMTMKLHSLLHLTECVLDFGPLPEFSAFRPEHFNGLLTRQVHGTKNFLQQVLQRFTTFTLFHNMIEVARDCLNRPISKETFLGDTFIKCGALQYCNEKKSWRLAPLPYTNVLIKNQIRKFINPQISSKIKFQLLELFEKEGLTSIKDLKMFEKIKIDSRTYYTQKHDSARKSSCFLMYEKQNSFFVGRVNCFLILSEIKKIVCCIRRMCPYQPGKNAYLVRFDDFIYDIVDVLAIKDQMILANIDTDQYVSEYFGDYYSVEEVHEHFSYQDSIEQQELNDFIEEEYSRYIDNIEE